MDLIEASENGNLDRVRRLLLDGADPNIINLYGNTPLYQASYSKHLEVVKELLSAPGGGADPNSVNINGQTPLYVVSRNGHLEIVKELLAAGANPNIPNQYGITPLNWATINKQFEVVQLFKTYFPSLHDLSLRSVRKFGINVSAIPKNLL